MKFIAYLILSVFLFMSCQPEPKRPAESQSNVEDMIEPAFAEEIASAHKKQAFLSQPAIQFDINIIYGGKEILDGTLTLKTNSSQGKIEFADGREIIYSESDIYFSREFENIRGPRFTAYTWSYFFLLPYKLNDPGTIWSNYENKKLNSKVYNVNKLTFKPGIGDAPDDWYIVYADKVSKLTQVAAYIVTAGQTKEKAEEDPHAIQYLNYKEVDGVPIAQYWKFWAWRRTEGLTDQLGEASLKNIKFVAAPESLFVPGPNMSKG